MPVPTNLRADWAAFAAGVEARLAAGARAYGNRSLSAPPVVLAGEVEEELLDVCGWAFVLWRRLRALSRRLPVEDATASVQRDEASHARGATE
jgi:hypothetical protein